ncbi:MAG: peptide deformylase [Gaiellaceae bacterium]
MAVREVLRIPHPALKQVAPEASLDSATLPSVERLAQDLVDTMLSFPRCVGLAAPQLGELMRIVVVDVSRHPKGGDGSGLLVLVNPEIIESSGAEVAREGCLSVPDLTADVRRATSVVVEAFTATGDPRVVVASGFEARALQHEIDHLDGLLFLDRVESLSRDVFRRKSYG